MPDLGPAIRLLGQGVEVVQEDRQDPPSFSALTLPGMYLPGTW